MSFFKSLKLDLGLPGLVPEWKKLFSSRYLFNDISAGVTVACVAIPLSLAIALASGVPPAVGLVTAIIGGIICALFGGTPLAVSGPAAAMSILMATSVEKFGVKGVVFICLAVGVMQLLSGILRFGRLSRFVPLPVVAAFTSGIGVIIIIGQLPRVFGLSQPSQSHVFSVISHLAQYVHHIKPSAMIIVAVTIAIIRLLPKVLPKVPSALVAVVVATGLVHLFSLGNVPVIGEIPRTLPAPHLPLMATGSLNDLLLTTFTIYLLACLETLLSSSAIDKLVKTEKHDPDQELIGQGLGNVVSSLFSGIPLTGVIARSAVNVKSGAKTRRSSIIHSIVILLTVYFAAPLIEMIPIAALAGVLLSVAFSMINYQEFRNLLQTSRSEAAIYLVTFLMIIFVDLTAGVQIGILSACLIVLIRASKSSLHISGDSHGAIRLSLMGPLTFLSLNKVNELEKSLDGAVGDKPIILDLSNLTDLDSSGASALLDFINSFQNRDFNVYLKGLPQRFEAIFAICEGEEILKQCTLVSESELKDKERLIKSFHGRLLHGVNQFHANREDQDRLRDHLAKQQDPHTLFITCSDSRILTSRITQSDPGELFIVRNVGNFIPPYDPNEHHSEIAALEFALIHLDIREIVICGHSNCGAMNACLNPHVKLSANLNAWITKIRSLLDITKGDANDLSKQNILNQINNLKGYPIVKEKLAANYLNIHGWFIDFEKHVIYEWDNAEMTFRPIGSESTVRPQIPLQDETLENAYMEGA